MVTDATAPAHSLPAAYLLYLFEVAKRWGIAPEDLLEGTGLTLEALARPDRRLPVEILVKVLERTRARHGQPSLGLALGFAMRVSAHGPVSTAALSASTVQEGLDVAVRYLPVVTTALALRLRVEGREASLVLEERADFGAVRDVVVMAILIGIWRAGEALTGRSLGGSIELALPAPGAEEAAARAPRIRFGQKANRLVFEASTLAVPYRMADPVAMHLAREQCERALKAMGLDGRMTTRVTSILSGGGQGKKAFPSLERVAATLHVSSRTLKRQLAAEGSSFSALIEKERQERAMLLLGTPGFSVKEVAGRLGYSNVANFTRAFTRWTGKKPAATRTKQPGGAGA
jgi:AraC-like DNA-binding protein